MEVPEKKFETPRARSVRGSRSEKVEREASFSHIFIDMLMSISMLPWSPMSIVELLVEVVFIDIVSFIEDIESAAETKATRERRRKSWRIDVDARSLAIFARAERERREEGCGGC